MTKKKEQILGIIIFFLHRDNNGYAAIKRKGFPASRVEALECRGRTEGMSHRCRALLPTLTHV